MAITRTPIIDDDGSGMTGTVIDNAWKQEFYNQIDALVGGVTPISGSWTPTDDSGAGLVLGSILGLYVRTGSVVTVWGQAAYPATANGAVSVIGGLPFTSYGAVNAGFYGTYGLARVFHVPAASTLVFPIHAGTGVRLTNAELSGALMMFQGQYLV